MDYNKSDRNLPFKRYKMHRILNSEIINVLLLNSMRKSQHLIFGMYSIINNKFTNICLNILGFYFIGKNTMCRFVY